MKKRGFWVLLLVTILAFWQIAFLQKSMKWDFTDAYLPSRYFFSEAILNNIFPFWNPYSFCGVPVYADLTSVFNPEFWVVANMFGYSNITLQFAFLAYVLIAGISFRFFLKQFKVEPLLALGLSVAYMLSGFVIGNSQHLSFIVGYSLLPLVIGCYIRFLRNQNRLNLVSLAVVCILMVYAGYPGVTIIMAYYMLGIFVYYLFVSCKTKGSIKKILLSHLFLTGIVLLGCAVFFLAFMQSKPFLCRYGGISLEQALNTPFTLKSFLSFVFPMATGSNPDYFNTDASMSNGYFGVFSLVLFLFVLTIKSKEKLSYVLLAMGGFFLIAALGKHFFVRTFLFDYIPLFDMFKYPAIFRSITIFSILAFVGINFNTEKITGNKVRRLIAIGGLIIAFAFLFIVLAFVEVDSKEMSKAFVIQGIIQIVLLAVFILLVHKNKKIKPVILLLFFIADGIISTQLSLRYTVSSDTNPIKFEKYLNSEPKGFVIPGQGAIATNSDRNAQNEFVWMNNNVFPKRVSFDGRVSFILDGYDFLEEEYPKLFEKVIQNPVLYFSDDVRQNDDIHDFNSGTVFLDSASYQQLENIKFEHDFSDNVEITNFSLSEIKAQTQTKHKQLLVLQQNYYTGWKVFVDGQKQKLLTVNFTHMAVEIPSGKHCVEFRYSNPLIIISFVLSMLVLLVLLTVLLFFRIKEKPENRKTILVCFFAGLAIFVIATVVNRFCYSKHKQGLLPEISSCFQKQKGEFGKEVTTFLSIASSERDTFKAVDYQCYFDHKNNIAGFADVLMNSVSEKFAFGWTNGAVCKEAKELLYSFYPEVQLYKETSNSGLIVAKKGVERESYITQDFEPQTTSVWKKEINRIETDTFTNNHFYVFHPEQKWGTTLSLPIDKEKLSLTSVNIFVDIKILGNIDDVMMVFEIKRGDKSLKYDIAQISDFVKSPGKWSRAIMVNDINSSIKEGDIIRVYFWNKNKVDFQIDNLKVCLQNK